MELDVNLAQNSISNAQHAPTPPARSALHPSFPAPKAHASNAQTTIPNALPATTPNVFLALKDFTRAELHARPAKTFTLNAHNAQQPNVLPAEVDST